MTSMQADPMSECNYASNLDWGQSLTVLQFTGQINLPKTGLWSFSLNSDDGSILYIDGAIFINNDGGCPLPMSKIMVVIIIAINSCTTPYHASLCN